MEIGAVWIIKRGTWCLHSGARMANVGPGDALIVTAPPDRDAVKVVCVQGISDDVPVSWLEAYCGRLS